MRFGLATPIVVQVPRARADWEPAAGIDDLAAIARTADRSGYAHLTCSEHVALPASAVRGRGATYWDPLATFGYLAALTERIRLATNILVLGYHHPLEIAKRYGTLDVVSKGRLILGLGVGSLEEEFALLGAPFADRGARADDAIAALRASLGRSDPVHRGPYYSFEDVVVEPHAVQEHVPIWMGGYTKRSLARAVAMADGWAPFALRYDQVAVLLSECTVPEGFDVVLGPDAALDPLGDPAGCTATVQRAAEAGATVLNVTVKSTSLAHYLEQIEAFMAVTRPRS